MRKDLLYQCSINMSAAASHMLAKQDKAEHGIPAIVGALEHMNQEC